jgi:hypothetical protein
MLGWPAPYLEDPAGTVFSETGQFIDLIQPRTGEVF